MKKKCFIAMCLIGLGLGGTVTAYAAPKTMEDGGTFDAEYYGQANPDVAAAVGTEEHALYQHYLQFGKSEGRQACASAQTAATSSGLIEAGDENYLRMGYLVNGFDYLLTPITERSWYTLENNQWVEHREPLETPRVTDPAAGFVRKDWSGDSKYQAIKKEIEKIVQTKGTGTTLKGETVNITQFPRSEEEYQESQQMLQNLSVDLVKRGIVDSCYLSWGSVDGYVYFKNWGYEQNVSMFANGKQVTMSQYDKHPEIHKYLKVMRNELYDDTAEVAEDGWGKAQ